MLGGAPTATLAAGYDDYIDRRTRKNREIIIEELRSGNLEKLEIGTEDDGLEIIYQFNRAIREGRTKENLRLLARVLCGLAQSGPIYASDFARFSRMISDMSREEIIVAGTLSRKAKDLSYSKGEGLSELWKSVDDELVPNTFKTSDHVRAIANSAQRTGLLMTLNSIDAMGHLAPSPLLDELSACVKFDATLYK